MTDDGATTPNGASETWPPGIPDLPEHNITLLHWFGPEPPARYDTFGCPPACPRRQRREEITARSGCFCPSDGSICLGVPGGEGPVVCQACLVRDPECDCIAHQAAGEGE